MRGMNITYRMLKFVFALSFAFLLTLAATPARAVSVSSDTDLAASIASGDSLIVLDRNITLSTSFDIPITKTLTIQAGNGNTLDGDNLHRIFTVRADVTFEGITFTNTKISGSGGAVLIETGNVRFIDCIFKKNNATADGGAVAVESSGSAEFTGATKFIENTAVNGGAVVVTGNLTFSGTVNADSNTATGNGGAVYATGTVTLEDGSFVDNKATGSGGAIYARMVTLNSAMSFSGNTAGGNGGAIVTTSDAVTFSTGGGSFTSNTAAGGGAIHAAGSVTASGGAFNGNTATSGGGGAVYSGKDITLTGVLFKENKALAASGGAFYNDDGKADITNCVFDQNQAISGGAACVGELTTKQTTFHGNIATGDGGAVYVRGGAKTNKTEDCLFHLNHAQRGGAVFIDANDHSAEFKTTYFNGNYANRDRGGALYISGKKVLLNRCTFANNYVEAGSAAEGGAAYLNATTGQIVNSTFTGNMAGSGKGGAVSFGSDSGRADDSAIFYSTFVSNLAGGGRGGALCTQAGTLNLVASVFVDNVASFGGDIFKEGGTIASKGYNIPGNFGVMGSGGPAGNASWSVPNVTGQTALDKSGSSYTRALLFGSNVLADNLTVPIAVGSSLSSSPSTDRTLKTLALAVPAPPTVNPALDSIPATAILNLFNSYFAGLGHTDERGVSRPANTGFCDAGAYESGLGGGDPVSGDVIFYVRMSGIPNTMTKIGQTCSLTAAAYYLNGTSTTSEPVSWSSSRPSVAAIDAYGNLVSLSQGTTTITVTTDGLDSNGRNATDSAVLEVTDEMSYTNVHPDVWRRISAYNATMQQYSEQLYLTDTDPAVVSAASFQSAFSGAYGVAPTQLTDFQNASAFVFDSSGSYTGSSWASVMPSMKVSLSSLPSGGGSLLSMRFTWSLSWSEVSEILGRTVTKTGSVTELFGKLKIVFEGANGATMPVVDQDGEYGIAASKALSDGALTLSDGNNGLTLNLDVMLGNIAGNENRPILIGNRLVVADGAVDGTVGGSLWLLKRTGSSSDSTDGGEGGGCNAGVGVAAAVLALWFARDLKRRES